MLKNKKLVIITLLGLIFIILLIIFIPRLLPTNDVSVIVDPVTEYQPEFMSSEELTNKNFPLDSKIQVFQRNENNEAVIYKIIRQEEDIIYDLDEFRQSY